MNQQVQVYDMMKADNKSP